MAFKVEELIIPFRGGTVVAVEARSTILVSAIRSLRDRGFGDRYESLLPPTVRGQLLALPTGLWIPIELAVEHYQAADRLQMDAATIEAVGGEVGERIYKSVLAIAVKLSKEVGVTPWSVIANAHRITDISWKGTDVAVWKLGPKEARYTWVNQPCARLPYFATSVGALLRALIGMFCHRAYVKLLPARSSETALSYRISWA